MRGFLRATACGLVVTELVINALKYGAGTVTVQVGAEPDGAVRMAVEDEGPGPPPGFDPAATTGLGMRILRALLRGGGIVFDHAAPRTRFVATLPG
jgi:two-component system, sensor histidine kinase PdtaS